MLRFLYALIVSLLCVPSLASNLIAVKDNGMGPIGPFTEFYEDTQGQKTIEEIILLDKKEFVRTKKNNYPSFGQTDSTMWMRFYVDTQSYGKSYWYILQDYQFVADISLFYPTADGYSEIKFDGTEGLPGRTYHIRNITFEIPTSISREAYYMRINSNGNLMALDIQWSSLERFVKYTNNSQLLMGMFYGGIIVLFIYNLVLWLTTREKLYFYYSYYTLTFIGVFLYLNGYFHLYFGTNSNHERYLVFTVLLPYHSMLLFARHILDLKSAYPRLYTVFKWFEWITLFLVFGSFFLFSQAFSAWLSGVLSFFIMPMLFATGFLRVLDGVIYAYYYLVGWAFILLAIVSAGLTTMDVLATGGLAVFALQIGSFWEMLFFSFAVSRKSKEYKDSSMESQKLAGYINHMLETFRADIAREMHDNVNSRIVTEKLRLERIEEELKEWYAETKTARVKNLLKLVEQSFNALNDLYNIVRNISKELHPDTLKTYGLSSSIKALIDENRNVVKNREINVDIVTQIDDLDDDKAIAIYRATQEVLANINKHSDATLVSLDIAKTGESVVVLFSDNGRGFDKAKVKKGLGLNSINAIATQFNGHCDITSKIGEGTQIVLKIPIKGSK